MKRNFDKWDAFLYPLKERKPPRPQDIYNVTTLEPISCMSYDLAIKLEQKMSVVKEDNCVKRNMCPTDEASESPTTKSPRTDVQQKTENVKGDSDNNDVIIVRVDNVGSPSSEDNVINSSKLTSVSNEDEAVEPVVTTVHSCSVCSKTGMNQAHLGTQKPATSSPRLPGQVTSTAQKGKPRKTSPKNHRSISLSQWTFNMFAEYIDFDEYVHELNFSAHTTGAEDVDLNVLFEDVLGMFGANNLKDCMLKENESRVLLDGILVKLSKKYKFRVQAEVNSKLSYLPPGKFDYLLTKDGVPFGCVEAKSPAAMERKSFCQAVLELNLVQQLALKKGVDVTTAPTLCILSDGYRFIFMQLKGRELLLEHETLRLNGSMEQWTAPAPKVIKIRTLNEPNDFKMLTLSITKLIYSSMPTAEGPAVKKDDNDDVILCDMPSN